MARLQLAGAAEGCGGPNRCVSEGQMPYTMMETVSRVATDKMDGIVERVVRTAKRRFIADLVDQLESRVTA